MIERSELGKIGENFAEDYLKGKGYRIIERNFRQKLGELDVVAVASDKTLVFIEVKTMREGELRPEDQMSFSKMKKFKRVASLYAGFRHDLVDDGKGWRMDVIALTKTGNSFLVNHYENVG